MGKRVLVLILAYFINISLCLASADELSQQATAFYSDNNYNKTMELLLQIDEKERSAKDWLLLGNLMDDKGEKDNAIFMYKKAVNTNPKFYKAYYNLGNIYLEQGKYNIAIENYKNAAKIIQTNPYIYYNLGIAYLKLGKTLEAKNAFLKAVTLKNDISDLQYNLAYVYKLLDKEKTAQIYLDNYNKLTQQPEY